jgi:hypothetical protein
VGVVGLEGVLCRPVWLAGFSEFSGLQRGAEKATHPTKLLLLPCMDLRLTFQKEWSWKQPLNICLVLKAIHAIPRASPSRPLDWKKRAVPQSQLVREPQDIRSSGRQDIRTPGSAVHRVRRVDRARDGERRQHEEGGGKRSANSAVLAQLTANQRLGPMPGHTKPIRYESCL